MPLRLRIAAFFAALTATLAVLVGVPAAGTPVSAPTAVAEAGNCSLFGLICGKIKNSTQSSYGLLVTGDYGDKNPQTTIGAGVNAPYTDDDGWYLPGYRVARVCIGQETPDACYTTSSNGWHKVSDGTNTIIVRVTRSSVY
jgi:hypothetical protein